MSKKLTHDFLSMRTKNSRLDQIRTLNLWGNDLSDVSILADLPNIEIISLSVNKITSLSAFKNMKHLRELYLRKNLIADIKEIEELKSCPNLKILSLIENPITEIQNYRQTVIESLPQLTKLDDVIIGEPLQQQQIEKKPSKDIKKPITKKKESMDEDSNNDNKKNPFNNNIKNEANNDTSSSTTETNKELAVNPVQCKPKERQIKQKAGGFKKFITENSINKLKANQKEQDFQVIEKKPSEHIQSSSFVENEPNSEDKPKEQLTTQMKYKKSYMRPTLNKSVNFDSYQTEEVHSKPQYKKKIIGQCSFANNPIDESGSKTNRLIQSQYTKPSLRYEDDEEAQGSSTERVQKPLQLKDLTTNHKHKVEDINSFPIKEEDENNLKMSTTMQNNKIVESIKLLLSTLNEKGLLDVKEEVNRLLNKSNK